MQSTLTGVGKQKLPDQYLGFCILPLDLAHIVTSGRFVVNISHNPKIIKRWDRYKL